MRTLLALLMVFGGNTVDLGGGVCEQTDGEIGMWNGTTGDDDGCVTPAEYAVMYSIDNLIAAGVVTDPIDNGDGTTTVTGLGVRYSITTDAAFRSVAFDGDPAYTFSVYVAERVAAVYVKAGRVVM